MEQPQVVIVGAGPGGLYAAMRLAQAGIPATVLEKGGFPRHKACGDILTSNVLRALHTLDPAMVDDLVQQPWVMPLTQTAFGSQHKQGFVMPFHSPSNAELGLPACLSAPRLDFDAWLAQWALRHPRIDLREGCAVEGIAQVGEGYRLRCSDGREVQAAYLVLATGANARLPEEVFGLRKDSPKDAAIGLRQYYEGMTPATTAGLSEYYLFDRKWMPGGLYITPFADGTANLNAVMRLDTWQRHRPALAELMQEYVAAHPQLRERFADARPVGAPMGSRLYLGTTRRPLSMGRCLLVGDAAGLTDATNANGIGHAMLSAGIAADHIALAVATQSAVAGYDAAVHARLRNALRPGQVMRALFSNALTTRFSVGLLNASLHRLNSRAVHELVYSANTTATLLNPGFYWRLFAKGGA